MEGPLESSPYPDKQTDNPPPSGWLRMGVVAAASALAGGLAAAWFYRKTLTRLRQAEIEAADSNYSIAEDDPGEDL
ncbi:MAG: hypothetical protein KGM96_03425 [Acidobacteriota bacterium]|nr:hypothetical protein [Acidobacteriota bacterium]